jgi:starch-binding outer membrane protein, SusD/RagB family
MNSLKIFLLILVLGFLAGACEIFTDPGKDNQYTFKRVQSEPGFAEGFLINGYYSLPNAYDLDQEAATDNAVSNVNLSNGRRAATGEWSAKFDPWNIYASTYVTISYINYFLTIVDTVQWSWQSQLRNDLFKQRLTGEAYALRGLLYHRLLARYGGIGADNNLLGVPIITKPIGINDDWKLPRATFQETVNQINSDYDMAFSLLPSVYANKTGTTDDIVAYNRVNGAQYDERLQGTIVKALKARLALLVASPAFNNGNYDVAKAATAATLAGPLLVAKGGIAGFPSDLRIYDADGDVTNTDILWRNNYVTNNTLEAANYPPSLFGNGRINPTQNLVDAFPMKNGYPIAHGSSGFVASNPYANRDPRLAYFVLYNGATLRSTVINTSLQSTTSDGLNKLAGYSTRTGYYLLKWLRVNINMNPTGVTTARHFYTHYRWTELYLNYAEAANEAWGPTGDPNAYGFTAKTIIGAVRKRAGINQPDLYLNSITDQAGLRTLIRNERRLELCFEGQRFWDLRRWQSDLTEKAKGASIDAGVYSTIDVENRAYPSYAVYGPLPLAEILKYPGLIQNNGW